MKIITSLLSVGLMTVTFMSNAVYAVAYKYPSRQNRLEAKRVRTNSEERRKRWLEASENTKAQMALLQTKADAELSKLSSEERKQTEEQIVAAKNNMRETMARLERMSSEEQERELARMHNATMEKLRNENPDAYQALKSMQEMGEAMEDLAQG